MTEEEKISNMDAALIGPWLITPVSLLLDIIVVVLFLYHKTFTDNPVIIWSFAAFAAILALSHLSAKTRFPQKRGLYLIIYHCLVASVMIFILPINSFYLVSWISLMYLSEFFFRLKGLLLSSIALIITVILGAWHQTGAGREYEIFDLSLAIVIILSTAIVLTHVILSLSKSRFDLSEKMQRAEYEHHRMIALVNNMSDGVLTVDQAGKVGIYNSTVLAILNTHDNLTDLSLDEVVRTINNEGNEMPLFAIVQDTQGTVNRNDLFIQVSENEKTALDISITKTSSRGTLTEQVGYVIIMRDITQQRSLNEERDDFISVVSHELRTPITIAEGNMAMASRINSQPKSPREEAGKYIDVAHKQIVFLADMINDLGTLSHVERKNSKMDVTTFNVEEMISTLDDDYRTPIESKGLRFVVTLGKDLPQITTSQLYLKEALQNIITNAMKYTHEGAVWLSAENKGQDMVQISVKDSGIGIAKNEQAKIFEKFWRSESPLTRQTNGTGLGLYITAKLIRRIGGKLEIDSELGKGTTFRVILPVLAADEKVDRKAIVKNELSNFYE